MFLLEIKDNKERESILLHIINKIFLKNFKNIKDAFIIEGFKYIESSITTKTEKISIEDVRELKKTIFLNSITESTKLIIINNAHNLTLEAQNTLLKILEEEPENTIIILCLSNKKLVLPTINSRGTYLKKEEIYIIHPNIPKEKNDELCYNKEDIDKDFNEIKAFTQKSFFEKLIFIKELTDKKNNINFKSQKKLEEQGKKYTVESFLINLLLYQDKFLSSGENRFIENINIIEEGLKKIKKNVNERAILEYIILRMNNGNK